MGKSGIEWTESVWNPITGCSHTVSRGCDHCYARRMAQRLRGRFGYPADDPFKVTVHLDRLEEPLKRKKSTVFFVCSMGGLHHEDVLIHHLLWIYGLMRQVDWHRFLVLTKRPKRMGEFLKLWPVLGGLPNVGLGVSVCNQEEVWKIEELLLIPAAMHFVSFEPLLEKVVIPGDCISAFLRENFGGIRILKQLDWVICGGESGPGARPMNPDWVRSMRDQCLAAQVPFFFKQWGRWAPDCLCSTKEPHRSVARPSPGHMGCMFDCKKKRAGRVLDGREWNERPEWFDGSVKCPSKAG